MIDWKKNIKIDELLLHYKIECLNNIILILSNYIKYKKNLYLN